MTDYQEIARNRTRNSLVWAGFSITNFSLLLNLFVNRLDFTIQVISVCLLFSGILNTISWTIYDAAAADYLLTYKNYSDSSIRKWFVHFGEITNFLGAMMWGLGVEILLMVLEMKIVGFVWGLGILLAVLVSGLPYFFLRKEKSAARAHCENIC
jgi:hypothetical protein